MKLFLIVLLIILVMLVGIGLTKQYRQRHQLFNGIMKFLKDYELNIGFKKDKILKVVNSQNNLETKVIFDCYKEYLINNKEMNFSGCNLLNDDEKEYLLDMFLHLGSGDYQTEKDRLAIAIDYFKNKIETSGKTKTTYCPMILKLCFLLGVGVAILLI